MGRGWGYPVAQDTGREHPRCPGRHSAGNMTPCPRPFPLPTGGVGYLSYEYCRRFDDIRAGRTSPILPDCPMLSSCLKRVSRLRSLHDTISIVGLELQGEGDRPGQGLDETRAASRPGLNFMAPPRKTGRSSASSAARTGKRSRKVSSPSRGQIVKGNLLQGVLSAESSAHGHARDQAYRSLRHAQPPSPYHVLPRLRRLQLFGASRGRLHVKVRDGAATIRPLAGPVA